ncbi:hypothetical protein Agub_g14807 [Astrephomene gubernaculifera]|uniref:Uncharacterized protein n=1 Tax=Astrephomene gubernaculifera TaxID=47775 RepID=A0AAD3E485_9CHLO|nr:hypothetical protein Agub_g14807 [Astrephomene gubernaculifera]
MYFRLLSMRILVDWENKEVWQTMFFYYFLGTWAMMNAWAIWGVAEYYGKYGNKGVDQTSFGTLVVVNLQTIQLLLYYLKLLSSETRLVSLNQLFERAPVEAQHLLEYTYVVEEDDVIEECYRFSQATQYTGLLRGVNIATFGLVGKSWLNDIDKATFSIDRLKQKAGNYEEVEEKVKQLRASVAARQQLGKAEASVAADGARKPGDVTLIVNNNNAATAAAIAANPTTTTSNSSKSSGLRRWWFSRMYASKHSLAVTFMDHYHSWPFRPDVKYFRMLTFIQAISVFAVGAIVVLGWQYSARDSTCAKSAKSCNTCLAVHERYFNSAEPLCDAMETAITRIVASANGTWLDNGVLEERYCNFECYGNFTPSQTCPALGR